MLALAALLFAVPVAAAPGHAGTVAIAVTGLRNNRGTIRLCMTRNPSHFPDCSRDPAAMSQTVSANTPTIEIPEVLPGIYAIAVIHDENNNKKLDSFLGIPREGFGFSRNPKIRFGVPEFDEVDIKIEPGFSRATVRIQYLL